MKILVTGATGFLGQRLTRQLLETGYQLKIIYRAENSLYFLKDIDADKVKVDLDDLKEVEAAVKGCDAVIHLASLYKFYPWWQKNPEEIYQTNISGTKNLIEASLKYKIKRFVFTSSVATFKDAKNPIDLNSKVSHYARSKRRAEIEVEKASQKGLATIILNPAIIIGEGDYRPTPSGEIIIKFLNKEYPFYFDANLAVVDLEDVVKAHLAALTKGETGRRYLLANDKVYTLAEFFKLAESISGIKSPKVKLPFFLVLWLTYLDELISLLLGKKQFLPLEGIKFCKTFPKSIENQEARKDLGYKPTPLKESLKRAISWYEENGYLKNNNLDKVAKNCSFVAHLFLGAVKVLQFLTKIGFSPTKDPWRKTAQNYLRTEHAKFSLGCPRLEMPEAKSKKEEKKIIVKKIKDFIKSEPSLCWKLKWTKFAAYPKKTNFVDIVEAKFSKEGNLENFSIIFDNSDQATNRQLGNNPNLIKGVCRVYNQTKDYPDKKRPLILKKRLFNCLRTKAKDFGLKGRNEANIFGERFLAATFVSFENTTGLRYQAPDFIRHKNAAYGFLNFITCINRDCKELDLWLQCHHACNDGMPVQECLNRLKKNWSSAGRAKVSLEKFRQENNLQICSTQNKNKGVYLGSRFIDFMDFLRTIKKNNRSNSLVKLTFFRFFIWKLGNHPIFKEKKFIIPIDLHKDFKGTRTLGFSAIKPSSFFNPKAADQGLLSFQKEFDCQINLALRRCSEISQLFRIFSLLPPFFYTFIANFMHSALKELTGDLGISIIDKADFFIAPYSDIQTDGFIALSNFFTPTDKGRKACFVSCKGPYQKVNKYLDAVGEVAKVGGINIL